MEAGVWIRSTKKGSIPLSQLLEKAVKSNKEEIRSKA